MICWMGERTNAVLDRHNVCVQGFDLEREANNAWCIVGMNGMSTGVNLGNVEGLTHEQIERRFAAAMLQFAISAAKDGDSEGYEVLDELLESMYDDDGECPVINLYDDRTWVKSTRKEKSK